MDRDPKYAEGEHYHIFNKNISGLAVFKKTGNRSRFMNLIQYYQSESTPCAFSQIPRFSNYKNIKNPDYTQIIDKNTKKLVDILAYCLMPNHFHLLLKQSIDKGIPKFLNNVLNSFTRFYNIKNDRKGPIWVGRSKSVHVANDEQLWHLTRYIHLNPVKANLVNNPYDWVYSSYREYVYPNDIDKQICSKSIILDSFDSDYKNFVEEHPTDAVGCLD